MEEEIELFNDGYYTINIPVRTYNLLKALSFIDGEDLSPQELIIEIINDCEHIIEEELVLIQDWFENDYTKDDIKKFKNLLKPLGYITIEDNNDNLKN